MGKRNRLHRFISQGPISAVRGGSRWRRPLLAAVAATGLLGAPAPLLAQSTPFTGITGFGDSYADTGSAPGGAFRLLGFPCPAGPPTNPTCQFSQGTNFVDSLQSIYNLAPLTNYAIGGAQTGNTNVIPGLPGFSQEVAAFVASGHRFGSRDLIALSIGGNDQAQFNSANSIAQIQALATTSASNAATGVQQLIALGAHNIAWVSPGNPFYFPAPFGDPATTPAQRAAWAHTYYQQVQQLLAPAARAGTRIFLFDYDSFEEDRGYLVVWLCQRQRLPGRPGHSGLPRGLDGGPEQLFLLGRHSSDQCGLLADRPLHGQPDGCAAHRGAASRRGARNGDELRECRVRQAGRLPVVCAVWHGQRNERDGGVSGNARQGASAAASRCQSMVSLWRGQLCRWQP